MVHKSSALAAGGTGGGTGGGVISLQGLTGALNLTSTGNTITITASGSNVDIESVSGGAGTVTSISGVTANGFAFSIANPSSSPAITAYTTITGVLQGNGTAISSVPNGGISNALLANSAVTVNGVSGVTGGGAVALGSSITLGMADSIANTLAGYNSSGVFSDVSIGSNLSLVGGILNGIIAPAPVSSVFTRTGAVVSNWNDYQFNLIGGTASVSQGGTGQTSLTIHSVLIGEGSVTGVGFATTGTAARILIDQGVADPAFKPVAGDVSMISTGVHTVLAVNGVTYPSSPSTNTIPTVLSSNVVSYTTALPNGITATTQASTDNSTLVATDQYVMTAITNALAAINPAVAVQAATTSAGDTSSLTYNNGVTGVGATFTGPNNTSLTVDGFTFNALGQRLLVKDDTQSPSGAFNGIYYVTTLPGTLQGIILTRALDYDQPSDINNTGAIPVINGAVNALTSWVEIAQIVTVGITPLVFEKFSYNPSSIVTTFSAGSTGFTPSSATSGAITLAGTLAVASGGTAQETLTAHAVMLGEGTSAVGFATIGTGGRLLIDQGSGADPAFTALSGGATITSDGKVTLGNPSASTLGGIQSLASVSHKWINAISTSGVPSATQPAFTDVSGTLGNSQINSGTFGSIPSAATAGAGGLYYATDLGNTGVLLLSTGSIWKPVTGTATIYQSGVQTALHTGDTTETNVKIVTIPAGLVSANGSLRIAIQCVKTGTNATATWNIYLSATSGGTNGTQFFNVISSAATKLTETSSARIIWNRNAQNSQVTYQTANLGSAESTATSTTMAINMANASYLNFTAKPGSASDAVGYDAVTVEWLEP